MAKATKSTHGVGTDQGGGTKGPRKEAGVGGKGGPNKKSSSQGQARPAK